MLPPEEILLANGGQLPAIGSVLGKFVLHLLMNHLFGCCLDYYEIWSKTWCYTILYTKSVQPFPRSPPHLLPSGQCIVEQTTLSLLNSLIVYCRVSSNFHFSFSIILCLVQKKWYVQKIPRGGWSGFGMALIWIDPNFHENCLDWSKLFLSLSKLHPNRRCSAILPGSSFFES